MKKTLCLTIALAFLIMSIFSGCQTSEPVDNSTAPEASPAASGEPSAAQSSEPSAAPEPNAETEAPSDAVKSWYPSSVISQYTSEVNYPINGAVSTLSFWYPGSGTGALGTWEGYDNSPYFMAAHEATGIDIDFRLVAMSAATEQYNLMCSAGEYMDMIYGAIAYHTGGVVKAIEDEVIIDLAPYIEQNAPDFWGYVNEVPNGLKDLVDDNGNIGAVHMIMDGYGVKGQTGLIRTDWLDELGMDVPETYDEMYEVLSAIKTEYDCPYPLITGTTGQYDDLMVGGYGTPGFFPGANAFTSALGSHLYRDGDVVKSSFLEDGYKDYLEMMTKWYDEGLISSNFAFDALDYTELISGNAFMFYGGGMDRERFASEAPDIPIAAIMDIVKEPGDKNIFGDDHTYISGTSVSVSTACSNPEIAVGWLNWWYTLDGIIATNFGERGFMWDFNEEGVPQFSDFVVHNPDGYTMGQVRNEYATMGICTLQLAQRAWNVSAEWMSTDGVRNAADRTGEGTLPDHLSLTPTESEEYSNLIATIETYAQETIPLFIMGDKSLDEWDAFGEQCVTLGLNRVIEIYQDAYNRYLAR